MIKRFNPWEWEASVLQNQCHQGVSYSTSLEWSGDASFTTTKFNTAQLLRPGELSLREVPYFIWSLCKKLEPQCQREPSSLTLPYEGACDGDFQILGPKQPQRNDYCTGREWVLSNAWKGLNCFYPVIMNLLSSASYKPYTEASQARSSKET